MTKEAIIEKTLKTLNSLPDNRAEEVADFADYIMKKYEDQLIVGGIQKLTQESHVFDFLNNEENIYSMKDIKKKY